uniref:Uncharacterized protein n=1 Tax=Arundo donax TaxID=35708 RepID=A0A0A9BWX8_ARUDO
MFLAYMIQKYHGVSSKIYLHALMSGSQHCWEILGNHKSTYNKTEAGETKLAG